MGLDPNHNPPRDKNGIPIKTTETFHPAHRWPLTIVCCPTGLKPSMSVIKELGTCGYERNKAGEEHPNGLTHWLCDMSVSGERKHDKKNAGGTNERHQPAP